jgi:hypothetical protein
MQTRGNKQSFLTCGPCPCPCLLPRAWMNGRVQHNLIKTGPMPPHVAGIQPHPLVPCVAPFPYPIVQLPGNRTYEPRTGPGMSTYYLPFWLSSGTGAGPDRAIGSRIVHSSGELCVEDEGYSHSPHALFVWLGPSSKAEDAVFLSSYRPRMNGDGFHWPGRTGLMIAGCDSLGPWPGRDSLNLFILPSRSWYLSCVSLSRLCRQEIPDGTLIHIV